MYKKFKKTICLLKDKLDSLEYSPPYSELLNIQSLLILRIKYIEKCISKTKFEVSLLKKEKRQGKRRDCKVKIKSLQERIEFYQNILILLKNFGDAILFKYIDRFNIRSLMYDKNHNMLPSNGFISGKMGFKREWQILKKFIEHEMPSLLGDLTNVIRHGDICLLAGADPFVVEVKSSKNENKRTERQRQKLDDFAEYLREDKIVDDSGMVSLRISTPERYNIQTHEELFNELLEQAKANDSSIIEPERGIYYIAFKNVDALEEIFESISIQNQRFTVDFINFSDRLYNWQHFYPYTLSIKSSENLFNFISQSFFVVVVINVDIFAEFANSKGFQMEFNPDDEYRHLKIAHPDMEEEQYLSRNGFLRLSREFYSFSEIIDRTEAFYSGALRERLEDFLQAPPCPCENSEELDDI